jgi:hypothetical protein
MAANPMENEELRLFAMQLFDQDEIGT